MNHASIAKKIDKSWGYELWLANNEERNYCGKILHINKGHKSSMHFHVDKHETFYVLRGKLSVSLLDTEAGVIGSVETLEEGETMEIGPHEPHQLEALEELDLIEISTFHRDSDSKRVWR